MGITDEAMFGLIDEFRKLKAENASLRARLDKAVELDHKLSCNPGDIVFEANIKRNMISVYEITAAVIEAVGVSYKWKIVDGIYSNLIGFSDSGFGKTVFLTEAEAQAKLDEMKGGADKCNG